MLINQLVVEYVPVDSVKAYKGHARLSKRARDNALKASISTNGFANPILVDEDLVIIAGHGRLKAAVSLGMTIVPVIRLHGLTSNQKRGLRVADNRASELGGWDVAFLREELSDLIKSDYFMPATGFDGIHLDKILTPEADLGLDDDVELPDPPADPVTRRGDLWALGPHRIVCGDARDPAAYAAVLAERQARLLLTDPPFNVRIARNVSGLGRTKHDEFPEASGEMSAVAFKGFLLGTTGLARDQLVDGGLAYIFMDWRGIATLVEVGNELFDRHMNICIWAKTNAGMGGHYRSAHEMVGVFKKGTAAHINNIQLGRLGRNRTNVWHYGSGPSFSKSRQEDLRDHPTVKPIAMLGDIIRDASVPGDIVLDPFGGSGSTLLAAHRIDRIACLIELEPKFVDVTLRRFQERTSIEPVLLPDRIPLSDVRAQRQTDGGSNGEG